MKKPPFINRGIYHIFNRGVEKRDIYMDDSDYFRFIHCLFEFNEEGAVSNLNYYFNPRTMEVEARYQRNTRLKMKRRPLVEVLVFTLMPNHYHLMLRQLQDHGIVKFMQKLGTGYTNYFNKKHQRVGALLQGRFKAASVSKEPHFLYLPHYIHTNPLILNERGSIFIKFLESYRWSSFPDYVGIRNFPSVTDRGFLLDIFGGERRYRQYTIEKLQENADNSDNNIINIIF